LIDKRRHSGVFDVRTLGTADCDTGHHLVAAKVRERLVVSKQTTQRFHMEKFHLKKLKEVESKEQFLVEIRRKLAALENLDAEVDSNSAWQTIRENIKIPAKDILHYYELKNISHGSTTDIQNYLI
jgi:hypothetical protein